MGQPHLHVRWFEEIKVKGAHVVRAHEACVCEGFKGSEEPAEWD